MVIQQFCIKSVDIHLSSVKVNEIKAKSRIHSPGRAGEEGGGADPRSNGKQLSCGLKRFKADLGIFIERVTTLIQKTQSCV